jgi:hypothetical protein
MQFSAFNAVCPFEVGDKMKDTAGRILTITDIAVVHYVRDNKVEFRFEFDNSKEYKLIKQS